MSAFNYTLKNFLQKTFNLWEKGLPYIAVSVGPFFLAMVLGSIFPNILDILGLVSLIINNYNGFIIPALLRIGIYKKEVQKKKPQIIMLYTYVIIMVILASIGVIVKISQ